MRSVAKKILTLSVAGCMAMVGLVGCSQPEEEAPAVVEEEQPSYDLVIGAEDDAVVNLPVTNETNGVITSVQVKEVASTEFSANLMEAGQEWGPGQIADVFFAGVLVDEVAVDDAGANKGEGDDASDSSAAEAAAAETESAADDAAAIEAALIEDIVLLPTYDVQITMADGSVAVLHQLTLGTLMYAEGIAINVDPESGAAYITYVEDGSSASTLIAELQVIAEEEAAAQAAAEAEAAAAAAASQAASQSQSSSSGGGSYDSVAPSGSGSGSGGSAPSQSEDSCVDSDDLIFN